VDFIEEQYVLQKRILSRMVELGITSVLPGFAGFIPPEMVDLQPNASVRRCSEWNGFTEQVGRFRIGGLVRYVMEGC
jgi:alpha-N-acetylglucosaminidase